MNPADSPESRYVIVCVEPDPQQRSALVGELERIGAGLFTVEACRDAEQALMLVDGLTAPAVRVPLVITEHTLPGRSGVELLITLRQRADYRATRKLLVSADASLDDVRQALNRGALHRCLPKPWSRDELEDCVRASLTGFFVHHAPDDIPRLAKVIDSTQMPRVQQAGELERRALQVQLAALKRSFLANLELSDHEVEAVMGVGIDDALGEPPRREYPAGSVLLRQGEPVDAVSILVSGDVQLFREANGHEVVMHTHAAGRIIGLLSLAQQQRAFYTCRAVTDVVVIPLSLEELDTALQANPWLSGYFVTALIRSMSNRSKELAELQVQVDGLNTELRRERDQLADALQRLENAQMRLVESEKMATLGQLSAGVAHELNNPVAAVQRAAEFIGEDLVALLGERDEASTGQACLQAALNREPMSTREQRQCRAALTEAVGNQALAQRLVRIGITSPAQAQQWLQQTPASEQDRLLAALERYHQLGLALRNLSSCSRRIGDIVASLRSYTRADQAPVANVNVHDGLEDTLLMFGPALREVEVVREFGDLPGIECRVGELNQVWTNLISNALQAMENRGTLRLETAPAEPGWIHVRVIDTGPGVAPEHLGRVFELNFTTKQGQTGFGLGLGLAICRQIVTRHGGTIEMESRPGRTCATVRLPVRCPRVTNKGGVA